MAWIEVFVSALCPFAHRVRLVLAEKGVQARETEVDLRNKPLCFLEKSPNGKVPLLDHEGRLVWVAAVIGEYLDEVFPDRPLLPKDPHARARTRILVNFADTRLYARTEALLHSADPRAGGSTSSKIRLQIMAEIADDLRTLESQILTERPQDGSYWLGGEFSLADLSFYPWFEQVCVLERYLGFQMPAECHRLLKWREAIMARDAVRAIARPPEFYLEAYGRLLAI